MKNGFLKVAVTTPDLRVADCEYNKNQMVEKVKKMAGEKSLSRLFSGIFTDRIHVR